MDQLHTHTCNIGLVTIWSLGPTNTHAFMEEMEGEWPLKKPFGLKNPREELHMHTLRQSKWSGPRGASDLFFWGG